MMEGKRGGTRRMSELTKEEERAITHTWAECCRILDNHKDPRHISEKIIQNMVILRRRQDKTRTLNKGKE